jgi:hypothetical protein
LRAASRTRWRWLIGKSATGSTRDSDAVSARGRRSSWIARKDNVARAVKAGWSLCQGWRRKQRRESGKHDYFFHFHLHMILQILKN